MKTSRARGDAETMLEVVEHPERFCPVCSKRIGVCKHTRSLRKATEWTPQEIDTKIEELDRAIDAGKGLLNWLQFNQVVV